MADDGTYVQLPFEIDQQAIQADALARLRARWPDWTPRDGSLFVVGIEIFSAFTAAFGYIASQMPVGALRQFGLKLYGIPVGQGSPAATTISITVVPDTVDRILRAGSQLNIDGYAFAVYADTTVAAGATTATGIQVYCAVNAAGANNLTGDLIAQLSLPPWVTAVTVDAPTDGGSDPQTPTEYLNGFSSELRLRAKSVVTTRDYEIEGVNFSAEIGRIQAIGDNARNVQVIVATADGEIVSTPTKVGLAAHYAEFELVNDAFSILDPTYTTVNVTWSALKMLGSAFVAASVRDAGNALIASRLNPASWNRPLSGQPSSAPNWVGDNVIYRNDIIGLLSTLPGLQHVVGVTLSATGLTPDGSGNLTLPGVAPLPRTGTITGTVT